MMNQERYEKLERLLLEHKVEEDVEDVLLELCEKMVDQGKMETITCVKERFGKIEIALMGVCYQEEEDVSVLVKEVRVGKAMVEIEDYFL